MSKEKSRFIREAECAHATMIGAWVKSIEEGESRCAVERRKKECDEINRIYHGHDVTVYDIPEDLDFSKHEVNVDPFSLISFVSSRRPKSSEQEILINRFMEAKEENQLHTFTYMNINPSYCTETKQLVYMENFTPALHIPYTKWRILLSQFNPARNSRMMAATEYSCKCIDSIFKLVEFYGCTEDYAWEQFCDNSGEIGLYGSKSLCEHFTGSYNRFPDFKDLAGIRKFLAPDPWDFHNLCCVASGKRGRPSENNDPIASIFGLTTDPSNRASCAYCVGELAMDVKNENILK